MKYIKAKTTTSYIRYHFAFCPRCRRKIFNTPGVKDRFVELLYKECDSLGVEIISLECHSDYIYLYVSAPPELSPAKIVRQIKNATGTPIRTEFEEFHSVPNLWTRNYFVSTERKIEPKKIEEYVDAQRKR